MKGKEEKSHFLEPWAFPEADVLGTLAERENSKQRQDREIKKRNTSVFFFSPLSCSCLAKKKHGSFCIE